MLQPRQLERIAKRQPDAIRSLSEFMQGAGLALQLPTSFAHVADRLRTNKAFRRDFFSTVWLIARTENLGTPELLALVAVAACGPAYAADVNGEDAHEVLRWITDASSVALDDGAGAPLAKRRFDRKWLLVPAAFACVALVMLLASNRHRTSQPTESQAATETTAADTGLPEMPLPPLQRRVFQGSMPRRMAQRGAPIVRIPPDNMGTSSMVRPSVAANNLPAMTHSGASTGQRLTFAEPDQSSRAASPSLYSANGYTRAPVPTAVLSQRLGARALPTAYTDGSVDAQGRAYPQLLRRRPYTASGQLDDSEELVASNAMPSNPAGRSFSRTASMPSGIVRPVSLGNMAANILYSPAPAYPAAAAAARVQGQVTVQAQVDRAGNVASVRVVSGPPLLRDAALDAVQHWRYRPYLSAGRPVSASATAVMEFELP